MSEAQSKPLKWKPDPDIGFTARRRDDGGMHITFFDVDEKTLMAWREFALEHLMDSDRLTRNLYDLRSLDDIPGEAVELAAEANSDPAARNIRVAVVVSSEPVRKAVEEIAALTDSRSAEIRIFVDLEAADDWLSQPLNTMV